MRVKLSDITKYSKGVQINGEDLIDDGEFIYLNGGVNPSGRWNSTNVSGNTVTVSEGGNSSGYVNYISEPFWCGAHCYYLYDGPENSRYLYYALKSQQNRLFNIRSGACMPNIKKSDLGNFEFEYDSDEKKQNEVVSVLSKVEAVVAHREKELVLLDQLIKARFVELFGDPNNSKGYPIVKVQDVADIQVGVVVKPAQYYTDAEHGVKAFRSLNIGELTIKDDDWVYFNEEGQRKNSKSILKENDLVIVRSGAPGTACVVTKQFEGSNAVDVIIAHPNIKKVNPYYLCAFTNYPHGKRQIEAGTGGAAQQHFNVGKYKEMDLIYPPKDEQDRFVSFVEQIDKSKFAVQKALDETQTLFDSLMQEYFG